MVDWLSDSQFQQDTKQDPKISMLKDSRNCAYQFHHAVEAFICLPHSSLCFRLRWGQLHIHSDVWDDSLTYIPIEDTELFWFGFNTQIPYFIWGLTLWSQHSILNPNIWSLCWRGEIGPKQLALLLQSKGSSGLKLGPGWGRGLGLESIDNLQEEGSASHYADMQQFFRQRHLIS